MCWCPIQDNFTRTPFKFLNAGKNNNQSLQVPVTPVSFSVTGSAGGEDHLAERSPFEGAGLRGESKYRHIFFFCYTGFFIWAKTKHGVHMAFLPWSCGRQREGATALLLHRLNYTAHLFTFGLTP